MWRAALRQTRSSVARSTPVPTERRCLPPHTIPTRRWSSRFSATRSSWHQARASRRPPLRRPRMRHLADLLPRTPRPSAADPPGQRRDGGRRPRGCRPPQPARRGRQPVNPAPGVTGPHSRPPRGRASLGLPPLRRAELTRSSRSPDSTEPLKDPRQTAATVPVDAAESLRRN